MLMSRNNNSIFHLIVNNSREKREGGGQALWVLWQPYNLLRKPLHERTSRFEIYRLEVAVVTRNIYKREIEDKD